MSKKPTMLVVTVDRVPWDYEILGATYAQPAGNNEGGFDDLLKKLEKNATSMGADAIIGLSLVSFSHAGGGGTMAAYGTAIKRK